MDLVKSKIIGVKDQITETFSILAPSNVKKKLKELKQMSTTELLMGFCRLLFMIMYHSVFGIFYLSRRIWVAIMGLMQGPPVEQVSPFSHLTPLTALTPFSLTLFPPTLFFFRPLTILFLGCTKSSPLADVLTSSSSGRVEIRHSAGKFWFTSSREVMWTHPSRLCTFSCIKFYAASLSFMKKVLYTYFSVLIFMLLKKRH